MNVVGGYVVTDRMLQMFRKQARGPKAAPKRRRRDRPRRGARPMSQDWIYTIVFLAWLVGAAASSSA